MAAGVSDECLVQLSYAIGVAEPISIYVNTYGKGRLALSDGEIARKVGEIFDLRPHAIEQRLKLRKPIYEEPARYDHMGHQPRLVKRIVEGREQEVELFTWEKLDYVERIKEALGL